MWFVFALLSAVFAALTSVLAKVGIEGVNSNLATALRTCVVLAMAWLMVFITHTQSGIGSFQDLQQVLRGYAIIRLSKWAAFQRSPP